MANPEDERRERILAACRLLPVKDVELLADVFEVSKGEVCEEVSRRMAKLKKELRVSSILLSLMNDSLPEEG